MDPAFVEMPLRLILTASNPADEPLLARELERVLGPVRPRTVRSAEEWGEVLGGREPDLVITDYRMGWGDGLRVLDEAKAHWPGCPVIMYTAAGSEEVAVQGMKKGLDDYVVQAPGGAARLACAAQDAVGRARRERSRRQAEARYRELVEELPVGVLEAAPDGRILQANPALARMLGYPDVPSLLRAETRSLWFDPGERRRWVERLLRLGEIRGEEVRLRARDGSPVWAEVHARGVLGPDGTVERWRGVLVDVTERRRARRERSALLESSPIPTLLLSRNHTVVHANAAARDLLASLGHPGPGSRLEGLGPHPVAALLAPPRSGLSHHEITLPGPPRRILLAEARPVGEPGEEFGWVLVLQDITEERRLESRAALQERLASLGQMAAGMAHDFNNILTTIVGQADLLRTRADLPDDVRRRIETVEVQSFRAADLVHQVLDFARRTGAARQPLELLGFVKELTRLFERTFPENVRIRLTFEEGTYWIDADPAQIQQIVTNLAVNARDAMPEGGLLEFRLDRCSVGPAAPAPLPDMPPGEYVVLAVADTGCGIPPEHLGRIFEPFFTTKGATGGTGLGLAQVYGLVTQHGGFVDAASEPGRGTCLTVYLPARPLPPETASPEADVVPRGAGQTVLLAEDDPQVRSIVEAVLLQLGYRVLAAAGGAEARQLWQRHADEIQAVVTDLVMPGLDGRTFAAEVKERRRSVPVVAVTGYPKPPWAESVGEDPFDAWLSKPVPVRELARVLADLLAGRDAGSSPDGK
ncbi:MAG: ATP-binding protein [Deferrisomatales bacterium]